MAVLHHITKSYQDNTILDLVDLAVHSGETIALIGENGAGKTTLLKILLGEITPDEGTVSLQDDIVGYVPQEPRYQEKVVEESFGSVEAWRIDYALSLVSLDGIRGQTVKSLSGGQKTRLALAQVLAHDPEPTILLLDEPTNNLDSEGLVWLEHFIRSFQGAILLVSHDRSFINSVATAVVELKDAALKQYGGNYDFYLSQRALERASEEKQYEAYVQEKKRLERLLKTSKDRAKEGVRKKKAPDNDKFLWTFKNESVQRSAAGTAKAFETRLEQLDEVARPESLKHYAVSLGSSTTHDKKLVTLHDVGKTMGRKLVFKNVSLEIRGGDRWHIQGLNGSGKSTLLRLIASMDQPDFGDIRYADGITIGYFSQEVDGLDHSLSALENITHSDVPMTTVFRQAMSMGLDGQDLRKKTSDLSRGQQAKLAFTKLLLAEHDLLLLDEPTNHLDIATKERLERALEQYRGALLVASHDTYFIKQVGMTEEFSL